MKQGFRLPDGGAIDRLRPISFRFNNRRCEGYSGDTVASALLANGIHLVARSFKYHRPRGIIGSGAEEPNALLQVGEGARSTANARATQCELREGLRVASVNCWPSVSFDAYGAFGWFAGMLPAGFYYKTFMSPRGMWPVYERFIRRSAGFGVVASQPDPDRYDKVNAWCDVLVAGGGPAGISAALGAARCGARVMLADEQSEFGGGLLRSRAPSVQEWMRTALDELKDNPDVKLLPRCTVAGYYDHNFLALSERLTDHLAKPREDRARERLWRVRAGHVVLATGAIERPLVFGNNDLPGIMLASAVSTYVNRYAVVPGRKAVVFTNNNSAYRAVSDLSSAGVEVVAVVDARPSPDGKLVEMAKQEALHLLTGSVVVRASGMRHVSSVDVMHLSNDGRSVTGGALSIDCDLLAVSGGWSPAVHLHAQSGGKPVFDEISGCFRPGTPVQAQVSAGASNAQFTLEEAVRSGYEAGVSAAAAAGFGGASHAIEMPLTDECGDVAGIRPLWLVPQADAGKKCKRFVDFQNDTTADDIFLAAREGYRSIELTKRYTALGFGTDQGKTGNVNGMAILSQALKQDLANTGTTTFRPMYTPVTFGAVAGRELGQDLFEPVRKTPMHDWHVSQGAEFENVGQWKRPWYYPEPGETMRQAVDRECVAARNQVAMLDASTLGKIEIYGPDAVDFLNRIYTNAWSRLETGHCRYGLMLGEDGMVMDDGVTAKLGPDRYYMTTTTGGAAHVLSWMEHWRQTEWPSMRVYFTSVTDQWAVISIAGPSARRLLEKLIDEDVSLSMEDFPFMSFQDFPVAGVPARVFRVSFSGELSYEVNVPADYGQFVWERCFGAGQEFGVTAYGTETMHVLRAEKGFIIVGQDTDGSVTPVDLGMSWIVSKTKDFIGKRSLARQDCLRADRKQLVGLLTEDPNVVLPEGVQLVETPAKERPLPMIGHVTSSYWSECLGKSIALAVVKGGHSRMGSRIYAMGLTGPPVPVTVCASVFYDEEGIKQSV